MAAACEDLSEPHAQGPGGFLSTVIEEEDTINAVFSDMEEEVGSPAQLTTTPPQNVLTVEGNVLDATDSRSSTGNTDKHEHTESSLSKPASITLRDYKDPGNSNDLPAFSSESILRDNPCISPIPHSDDSDHIEPISDNVISPRSPSKLAHSPGNKENEGMDADLVGKSGSGGYYVTVEKHLVHTSSPQSFNKATFKIQKAADAASPSTQSSSSSWQSSFELPGGQATIKSPADSQPESHDYVQARRLVSEEHNYQQKRPPSIHQGMPSDTQLTTNQHPAYDQFANQQPPFRPLTNQMLPHDVQVQKGSSGKRQQALKEIQSKQGPRRQVKKTVDVTRVQQMDKFNTSPSTSAPTGAATGTGAPAGVQSSVSNASVAPIPQQITVQHELMPSDFISQLFSKLLTNQVQPVSSATSMLPAMGENRGGQARQDISFTTAIPLTDRKTPIVSATRESPGDQALTTPAPRRRLPKASPYEAPVTQTSPVISNASGGFMSHIVETYPSPLSPTKSPGRRSYPKSTAKSPPRTRCHRSPVRSHPQKGSPRSPDKQRRVASPLRADFMRICSPTRHTSPPHVKPKSRSPRRQADTGHRSPSPTGRGISPARSASRKSSPAHSAPRSPSPHRSRLEKALGDLQNERNLKLEREFQSQLEDLRAEIRAQKSVEEFIHPRGDGISPLDKYLKELEAISHHTRPLLSRVTGRDDLNTTFSVPDLPTSDPESFLTKMAARLRKLEAQARLNEENTATLVSLREKSKSQAYSAASRQGVDEDEEQKVRKLVDRTVSKAISDVEARVREIDFQPKPLTEMQQPQIPSRYKTAAQRLQAISAKVDTGIPKHQETLDKENRLVQKPIPDLVRDEKYMRRVYGNAFYNAQRRTSKPATHSAAFAKTTTNHEAATTKSANKKSPAAGNPKLPYKTVSSKKVASKKIQSSPEVVEETLDGQVYVYPQYRPTASILAPRLIIGPGLKLTRADEDPSKIVMETVDTLGDVRETNLNRPEAEPVLPQPVVLPSTSQANINNNAADDAQTSPEQREEENTEQKPADEPVASPIVQSSQHDDESNGTLDASTPRHSNLHSTPIAEEDQAQKIPVAAPPTRPDWEEFAVEGENLTDENGDSRSRTDDIITPPPGVHGAYIGRKPANVDPQRLDFAPRVQPSLGEIMSADRRIVMSSRESVAPPDPTQLATADWVEQQVMARVVRRMSDRRREMEERLYSQGENQPEWIQLANQHRERIGADEDGYTAEERARIKSTFKECLRENIRKIIENHQSANQQVPSAISNDQHAVFNPTNERIPTPEPTPPTSLLEDKLPTRPRQMVMTPPLSPKAQSDDSIQDELEYGQPIRKFVHETVPSVGASSSLNKPDQDVGIQTMEAMPPTPPTIQSENLPDVSAHSPSKLHLSQVSLWDTLSAGDRSQIGAAVRDEGTDLFEMRYSVDTPVRTPDQLSPQPTSQMGDTSEMTQSRPLSVLSNPDEENKEEEPPAQPQAPPPVMEDASVQAQITSPLPESAIDNTNKDPPPSADTSSVSDTAGKTVSEGEWILRSEGQISPRRVDELHDNTNADQLNTLDEMSTSSDGDQSITTSEHTDISFSTGQVQRKEDLNLSQLRQRLAEQRKKLTASAAGSPSPTYKIKRDARETGEVRPKLIRVSSVDENYEFSTPRRDRRADLVNEPVHVPIIPEASDSDEISQDDLLEPSRPTMYQSETPQSVRKASPGGVSLANRKSTPGGVSLANRKSTLGSVSPANRKSSPGGGVSPANRKSSPGGISIGQSPLARKSTPQPKSPVAAPAHDDDSLDETTETDKMNTESLINRLSLNDTDTNVLLQRSIDEQGLSTAPSYLDTNILLADTLQEHVTLRTSQGATWQAGTWLDEQAVQSDRFQTPSGRRRPVTAERIEIPSEYQTEGRDSPEFSYVPSAFSNPRFSGEYRESREMNSSFARSLGLTDSLEYRNTGSPAGILRNSYESTGGITPRNTDRKQLRFSLDYSEPSESTETNSGLNTGPTYTRTSSRF